MSYRYREIQTNEWDSEPTYSCLPTTYWPPTDHQPTTNWPPTDRPPTDHLPTTFLRCSLFTITPQIRRRPGVRHLGKTPESQETVGSCLKLCVWEIHIYKIIFFIFYPWTYWNRSPWLAVARSSFSRYGPLIRTAPRQHFQFLSYFALKLARDKLQLRTLGRSFQNEYLISCSVIRWLVSERLFIARVIRKSNNKI